MHSRAPSQVHTVRERALGDSCASVDVAKREGLAIAAGVVAPGAAAEHYPELSGAAPCVDLDRAAMLPNTSSASMQSRHCTNTSQYGTVQHATARRFEFVFYCVP